MASIWVVEQGEYSDYGVLGVFSTKENAETLMSHINKDMQNNPATVDEWPLNPGVSELRQGYTPYYVVMSMTDGATERCEKEENYLLSGTQHEVFERWQSKNEKPPQLWIHLWAKDETHAIKIANEHRMRMIAEGSWREKEPV